MKNVRELFRYIFVVTILFVGCKDNNIELPDVELKILTSVTPNPDFQDWTDTLAIFDTPWSSPLDLSNMVTFKNINDSSENFSLSLSFQEADLNKEIYLFRVFPSGSLSRNIILGNNIQISDSSYTYNFSLDSHESYSIFLIDRFGDILASPISINFESLDSDISEALTLSPNQLVKNDPTLRIDASDLSFSNDDSLYGKVEAITLGNDNRYEPLVVVKIKKNSSFTAYSTSTGYLSISQRTKMDDGFELYLYTVDHSILNQ